MSEYNEATIGLKVVEILKEKGWKIGKNLRAEEYTPTGCKADYVLYDKQGKELVIIEVKKKGKSLEEAMEKQAKKYAQEWGAPIAYATDGSIIKTCHLSNGKSLILNGQEVEEFIDEELAYQYLTNHEYNNVEVENITITQEELIEIFSQANKSVSGEGISKGLPRFWEFCSLLFLKLFSEEEEIREKEGKKTRIKAHCRWKNWRNKPNDELVDYVNGTVWGYFQENYGKDIFTPLKIEDAKILREIIDKLEPLSLSSIDSDIKGDAFEYFLRAYSGQKGNDLGEYFTPRHIVKFMVKIANPQFGEKVYDPYCGTGGMLAESYKHIKKWMEKTEKNVKVLEKETIYGNDINAESCRVTKMNMILLGDGQTNIDKRNSLNRLENNYESDFHIAITNMPFIPGTYERTEKSCSSHKILLKRHGKLSCCKGKGRNKCPIWNTLNKEAKECQECWKTKSEKEKNNKEAKEKLYKHYLGNLNKDSLAIEHCFKSIKRGNTQARIIMIVPERILFDKDFTELREYIYKNCYVKYIISLPRKIFYAREVKVNILYLTNIKDEIKEEGKEKEWRKWKEQDCVWYYKVENDGFTFNTRRRKIEGINDLDLFLTKYQYLPELLEHINLFDDQAKVFLNEQLKKKFHKLEMKNMRENNYISLPNVYQKFSFGTKNETTLENLIAEVTERKDNAEIEVWSVTKTRGFIRSEDNFLNKVFSDDTSKYKLVPPQHFAYNPARANIGSINYNESQKTGCVSPAYTVFKIEDEEKICPRYLSHLLLSEQFKEQVKQICFGTVRQPLNFELFQKRIVIPLPSVEEQIKIIEQLDKIKENIRNTQQNIDNLNSSLSLSLSLMKEKRLGISV